MRAAAIAASVAHRIRRTLVATMAVAGLAAGALVAVPAQQALAGGSFVASINAARAAHGLPALAVSSDLSGIASSWAAHMAKQGTISHNPGLTTEVPNWQVVGENVGMGPDEPSIHQAFMNSAPHRANILDPEYTQVGVGTAYGSDGTLYVTEDFRKPMSSGTSGGSSTHPAPPATQRPAPAPAASPAPRPAAAVSHPAAAPHVPSPEELLRARLALAAQVAAKHHAADPLAGALGYARVMSTVAG